MQYMCAYDQLFAYHKYIMWNQARVCFIYMMMKLLQINIHQAKWKCSSFEIYHNNVAPKPLASCHVNDLVIFIIIIYNIIIEFLKKSMSERKGKRSTESRTVVQIVPDDNMNFKYVATITKICIPNMMSYLHPLINAKIWNMYMLDLKIFIKRDNLLSRINSNSAFGIFRHALLKKVCLTLQGDHFHPVEGVGNLVKFVAA